MDYRGDDPNPDCNTPGLIVDDVSLVYNRIFVCLSGSLDSLGHA